MSTDSANSSVNPTGIIFIDPTVANYQSLLAGVKSGVETFILDPNRDGILQISDILASFTGVSSVSIVSHGSAGSLELGNTKLSLRANASKFGSRSPFFRGLRSQLSIDRSLWQYKVKGEVITKNCQLSL